MANLVFRKNARLAGLRGQRQQRRQSPGQARQGQNAQRRDDVDPRGGAAAGSEDQGGHPVAAPRVQNLGRRGQDHDRAGGEERYHGVYLRPNSEVTPTPTSDNPTRHHTRKSSSVSPIV